MSPLRFRAEHTGSTSRTSIGVRSGIVMGFSRWVSFPSNPVASPFAASALLSDPLWQALVKSRPSITAPAAGSCISARIPLEFASVALPPHLPALKLAVRGPAGHDQRDFAGEIERLFHEIQSYP